MNGQVGVLLYEGCTITEIAEAATRLSNDVDVRFISTDGKPLRDQSGLQLQPDCAIAEFEAQPLKGLVVPGGDPGSIVGNIEVQAMIRAVADAGALVAGICGGVLVLADAGVLTHKRITHNYRAPWAPPEVEQHVAHLLADCLVEPAPEIGVVTDGAIVTALPNAAAEFALVVCKELGVLEPDRAQLLLRHLRGEHVPELFG